LKIALVSLNLRRGGLEKTIVLLAREIVQAGHDVRILVVFPPIEYAEFLRDCPGGTVRVLFPEGGIYFWTAMLRFARALRRELSLYNPDVCCAFGGQAVIISVLARVRRLCVGAQSASGMHWTGVRPGFVLLRWMERLAVKMTDGLVIACSPSVAKAYAEHFKLRPERIRISLNSSNLDDFADRVPALEKKLSPSILCVGTLYAVKNFPMAIRALALLRAQGVGAVLTFVGDGPDRAALERLVSDCSLDPWVRFVGQRADVGEYYTTHSILWVTSLYEGFGLVIAEAMASGVLVVGTDVRGVRDVVVNGETGHLVPSNDPTALAAVTLASLAKPEATRRIVESARVVAMERFHPRRMASEYLAIFDEVSRGQG
jgi:glycosyltransferase involved in cell wall biosynthesis